jgi:hypothetical protein
VLNGEINQVIDALAEHERAMQLTAIENDE